MDLLGSIMGSMDKPPTPSERERKMKKALKAKCDKHLEAEQKQRAKFRAEAEERVKDFMGNGDKKELSFPAVAKVYRAILHDVADAAGIYSHSVGEGEEKDLIITKEPVKEQARREDDRSSLSSSQTTPTATPPLSDYRQKYQHLIGGLECAEKTAVRMEPNRSFGYVPSANKRDHRSIEETMNDLRTKKKPRIDTSEATPPSTSSQSTSPSKDITNPTS